MTDNRFNNLFSDADAAFNAAYKNELNELKGLSSSDIDSIIPGTAGSTAYSALLNIVETASKENLSQAALIENIKGLGDIAVQIARKVPQLAALL
jgi:hypothetical protein